MGASAGKSLARPEEALGEFDLVFAKAKAALEAMSIGAAVILCDAVGAGPMVTTANLDQLRRINFGMRALTHPVTPEFLGGEIARYDAADAAAVSRAVRESAGTEAMVDELCSLYAEVIAEHAAAGAHDLPARSPRRAQGRRGVPPAALPAAAAARPAGERVPGRAAQADPRAHHPPRGCASRRSWIAQLLRMELD